MVTKVKKEKIKQVLSDMKIELAVELDRVKSSSNIKTKGDEIWDQYKQEESKIKNHPIKKAIDRKFSEADMGMYIKDIKYTPEEQDFIDHNPSYRKMAELIDSLNMLEKQDREQLKERLKSGNASESEMKDLNNVEFKIWDSGKEMLGDKGNDLPAFSVDSDFYDVFNYSGDIEATHLPEKTECKLRQQLRELGVDYENYDYSRKEIVEVDPLTKTQFLEKNDHCKKWLKPKSKKGK